jgi:hypothetical protein
MSNGMHLWLGHPVAVILRAVPNFQTDEEGDVGTPAGLASIFRDQGVVG